VVVPRLSTRKATRNSQLVAHAYEDVGSFLDRVGAYDRSGDYEKAVGEIESYLAARLADEQQATREQDGVDVVVTELHQVPAHSAKSKIMLTLANLYLKQNDYKKGVRTLEALAELAPDDPSVWCVWGRHEWRLGRYKSAKDKFEYGMTLKPHSALLVSYASMEAQRRNRTKARALLKQAVEVGGQQNPHAWVSYAQLEGRHGNPRKGIRICEEGLEIFPTNTYLWCTLGTIHENAGDDESAKKAFKQAMEIDSKNTFAIHELGKLASKHGELQAAQRLFQTGVDSDDPKGVMLCAESLCSVYMFQGEEEKARALFQRVSARYCGATNSRFLRAWASFEKKTGNVSRASELFSASAKLNPRDERTWLQWAQLESRRNKNTALECVRAGVNVSPLNPFLWQLYGTLSWDVEGAESGRDVFTRGVKNCSRNQQLLMAWAIMEIQGGEPRRALDVLRRGDVSRRGRHEPLLDLWVRTAKSVGEEAEAVRIERRQKN
jgi:tetratricopeptide (TPR) repeat protein